MTSGRTVSNASFYGSYTSKIRHKQVQKHKEAIQTKDPDPHVINLCRANSQLWFYWGVGSGLYNKPTKEEKAWIWLTVWVSSAW